MLAVVLNCCCDVEPCRNNRVNFTTFCTFAFVLGGIVAWQSFKLKDFQSYFTMA